METYRPVWNWNCAAINMLEYNMFKQAQITFPGENDLRMILPDSVIAREKSEILVEYLHKVFARDVAWI